MWITSINYIRRNYYHLFKLTHWLFVGVLFFGCLHVSGMTRLHARFEHIGRQCTVNCGRRTSTTDIRVTTSRAFVSTTEVIVLRSTRTWACYSLRLSLHLQICWQLVTAARSYVRSQRGLASRLYMTRASRFQARIKHDELPSAFSLPRTCLVVRHGRQWEGNVVFFLGGIALYTVHVVSRLKSWKR